MKYHIKEIPGKVHDYNGDSHYARVFTDKEGKEWGLFMVADGLSGSNEILASHKTMRLLSELLEQKMYNQDTDIRDVFSHSIVSVNTSLKGARTTLDVMAVSKSSGYLAHVGDSQVYFVYDNHIKKMTVDECTSHMPTNYLGEEYVDRKHISERITLTTFDQSELPKRILLATDGLGSRVTSEELQRVLLFPYDDPRMILDDIGRIVYQPKVMLSRVSDEKLRKGLLYGYLDVSEKIPRKQLIDDAMALYLSGTNVDFVKKIDAELKFDDTTMVLVDLEDRVEHTLGGLRDQVRKSERNIPLYKQAITGKNNKIKNLNSDLTIARWDSFRLTFKNRCLKAELSAVKKERDAYHDAYTKIQNRADKIIREDQGLYNRICGWGYTWILDPVRKGGGWVLKKLSED